MDKMQVEFYINDVSYASRMLYVIPNIGDMVIFLNKEYKVINRRFIYNVSYSLPAETIQIDLDEVENVS